MMYDDLIKILNEHRRGGVMCDEGCICWELERILYEHWQEQEGQPEPGSDHYFPNET